ncbi:MAG: ATP-binding protein [Kiritimatiellae bacterium]|nr:ATP-binding protein [Kiritimatiellia bacterium]
MSKQIYVQAQADHIESLFKAAPLSAVEELVWNALDADAREVKVDLITNPLGAVDAVRVADDGTGINVLRADSTFGSLGGSWKREGKGTELSRRRLHGRHGRGRFKAFALGGIVEWRTTMRVGGELMSYRIRGEEDRPGVFELDAAARGTSTGTEVYITNVKANCDSLLDATETVQNLSAKFALYLKSYPDVRIYFNGIPVTPVIVQKRTSDYRIVTPGGAEAKLEIIEWKRKFTGSGKLVFAGPDGFQLHEQPSGVRSGTGASFTAYLVSPRFPALHAENALMMDELNPEVRGYLDETKKAVRRHFASLGEEKSAFELEWEERLSEMSREERKTLAAIIKRLARAK